VPPGPEPLPPGGPLDPGLVQPNGLDVDLEASLAAHRALAADWEPAVAREAERLIALGARLVVGDVPPLCFAAARLAGVPSLAVANFGWDWILDAYAASDPRWQPIAARYRDAYAAADLLLRLPLSGDLSAFRAAVDVPLLVNVSTRPRDACRRALGLAPGERRRVVLVSFGGFGAPARSGSPRRLPAAAAQADDDLSDYLFLGAGAPPPGLAGQWRGVRTSRELPHEDVIHACDAVIGKPGYGTVAEVVAHAARFLYLPRDGFRETAPLLEGLAAGAAALPMPREDFAAGRWRRHLDALFELPLPARGADTGGADAVADAILAWLENDPRSR
jgi:hypothetical protein